MVMNTYDRKCIDKLHSVCLVDTSRDEVIPLENVSRKSEPGQIFFIKVMTKQRECGMC